MSSVSAFGCCAVFAAPIERSDRGQSTFSRFLAVALGGDRHGHGHEEAAGHQPQADEADPARGAGFDGIQGFGVKVFHGLSQLGVRGRRPPMTARLRGSVPAPRPALRLAPIEKSALPVRPNPQAEHSAAAPALPRLESAGGHFDPAQRPRRACLAGPVRRPARLARMGPRCARRRRGRGGCGRARWAHLTIGYFELRYVGAAQARRSLEDAQAGFRALADLRGTILSRKRTRPRPHDGRRLHGRARDVPRQPGGGRRQPLHAGPFLHAQRHGRLPRGPGAFGQVAGLQV